MMSNEEYLQNGGEKCPRCGSKDVFETGDTAARGTTTKTSGVECSNCRFEWDDIYELTGRETKDDDR